VKVKEKEFHEQYEEERSVATSVQTERLAGQVFTGVEEVFNQLGGRFNTLENISVLGDDETVAEGEVACERNLEDSADDFCEDQDMLYDEHGTGAGALRLSVAGGGMDIDEEDVAVEDEAPVKKLMKVNQKVMAPFAEHYFYGRVSHVHESGHYNIKFADNDVLKNISPEVVFKIDDALFDLLGKEIEFQPINSEAWVSGIVQTISMGQDSLKVKYHESGRDKIATVNFALFRLTKTQIKALDKEKKSAQGISDEQDVHFQCAHDNTCANNKKDVFVQGNYDRKGKYFLGVIEKEYVNGCVDIKYFDNAIEKKVMPQFYR
jgi:hypothetical protein